jgi:uncharacterized phage-like protein YoqJ
MNRKVCFIGHRKFLPKDIDERLNFAIKNEIDEGCRTFIIGSHGEFDRTALLACKYLNRTYKSIEIEVAITSVNQINPKIIEDEFGVWRSYNHIYEDVNTIMFDIEEAYFKNRIILSNRFMINSCDTIICYVNPNKFKSGAKNAMNYAKRKGLKIINLYSEDD